jgi:hypothetical protein
MPLTYEPIATTTVASTPTTTVTFTSIPSTYTDLVLVGVYKRTAGGATTPRITFNSSATGYSETLLYGDGTSAVSSRTTSATYLTGGTAADGVWSTMTMNIFSYAGSTNKTSLYEASTAATSSGRASRMVGLWANTAAITSVSILSSSSAGWDIGTIWTLYGIAVA